MKNDLFRSLHEQEHCLEVCNVWDAASAKVAKQLGYQAIATSSAAIAAMLGYEDGEQMTFDELHFIVERIANACDLPLTVDIEGGYSNDPLVTANHIKRLTVLGVVGINIEDSIVEDKRILKDANRFAGFLSAVSYQLKKDNVSVFINVRTDTFLLLAENQVFETCRRAALYKSVGADGLFVPGIVDERDIREVVAQVDLPINVMCMPNLPGFTKLNDIGVKRISMGNFLFEQAQQKLSASLEQIASDRDFHSVFH
ncbi:isocitrate lyase/PEP mutase family protein [Thalassotalea fusca]